MEASQSADWSDTAVDCCRCVYTTLAFDRLRDMREIPSSSAVPALSAFALTLVRYFDWPL